MHEHTEELNFEEFKNIIKKVIGIGASDEFKYQNLLFMGYNLKVFSINADYGLDYVEFNQRFWTEIKRIYEKEGYENQNEFESLITNNKINLANEYNFTRLYDDEYKDTVWGLIFHSIKLDNPEFVNLLLQKSGIKPGKDSLFCIALLYNEVTIILY